MPKNFLSSSCFYQENSERASIEAIMVINTNCGSPFTVWEDGPTVSGNGKNLESWGSAELLCLSYLENITLIFLENMKSVTHRLECNLV